MTRLRCDIETRSDVDLLKTNVYRYTESPEFRILISAAGFPGLPVEALTERDHILDWLTTSLRAGHLMVAHNAQFERICYSAMLGMPVGKYLDPEQFHDTQAVAAEHGYPQGLARLAEALGGEQKDEAGTRLINLFSKPKRGGGWNTADSHPEQWQEFVDYCVQDVVTLADVDDKLGDFPTETERQIYHADQRINDRGIAIDLPMARAAMQAAETNRMVQEIQVMDLTGIRNPGSQPQFLTWCRENIGPRIPNLQKETVSRLLASPRLKPEHRVVLELRQELALVASKKYASALESVSSDGRLRGTLKFFGAHTGRWAGKGTQLQNLPSESFVDADGDWDAQAELEAIMTLLLEGTASALDLKKMVRPMFILNGWVVDYSSIEARFIAWLAGEDWALEAFRAGRDIYVETAERMSTPDRPLTRKHGKVAVLALGYQGAINSLRVMGAEGDDEELQDLVDQWRAANRHIVRLWRDLQEAIGASLRGPVRVGRHLRVTRDPNDSETMRLHLPSGRAITYHGMRWEKFKIFNEKKQKWEVKEGWRYDDPKKPGMRISTYGGRLAENATQAGARDLMGEALVRLLGREVPVVAHVHDEIIGEGPYNVDKISAVMCQLPPWAKGLPVDGNGFRTVRYHKE